MTQRLLAILIALLAATSVFAAQPPATPQQVEAELRKLTQEMLDAIAPGHIEVWRKYLDARTLYVDETGAVSGKDELIKELTPLPAGLVGNIKIDSFKVELHGNVAVATHEDQEHLSYYGQQLSSRYRSTNTWLKTGDGWRLIATQVLALLKDPPAITLSQERLCAFNGVFALTAEITETLRCKDGGISAERKGRPEVIYKPEAEDVFFVPGRPRTRRIFTRDNSGAVTGFVDRREGEDVRWRKVQ
ncbi:MAG: nuclear transport factor 2 family protein [Acidobacteriales bacterium]|nr:nuclear transport factor 2 family protein [Terriglobales bacterium]